MNLKKTISCFAIGAMIFALSTLPAAAGDIIVGSNNDDNTAAAAQVDNVGAEATILMDNSAPAEQTVNSNGRGYRGFAEPANINYPGMPGYFGPVAKETPRFTPIKTLTMFENKYFADELENMDTSGWGDVDLIPSFMVKPVPEEKRATAIRVFASKPAETVHQVGFLTSIGDDVDVNSSIVMAKAAKEALKYGANAIYVTGEGAEFVLKSSGWGIGFNTTMATLSNSEGSSVIGGGGTGYSAGEAGYKDMPWLQIFVLWVPDLEDAE